MARAQSTTPQTCHPAAAQERFWSSIYHIPSSELTGYGLNSGGAHEIGVLQCFDILELLDKEIPQSSVLGIIPKEIDVCIGLSDLMKDKFQAYIESLLKILEEQNLQIIPKKELISLDEIIEAFKNPTERDA